MNIEMKAGGLAIPIHAYPHLHQDQSLSEAIRVIRSFSCKDQLQFSELLILNDREQLIGRVTVRESLQGLEPPLLKKKKWKLQFTPGEFFLWGIPASIIFMAATALAVAVIWPILGMQITLPSQ